MRWLLLRLLACVWRGVGLRSDSRRWMVKRCFRLGGCFLSEGGGSVRGIGQRYFCLLYVVWDWDCLDAGVDCYQ